MRGICGVISTSSTLRSPRPSDHSGRDGSRIQISATSVSAYPTMEPYPHQRTWEAQAGLVCLLGQGDGLSLRTTALAPVQGTI